MIYSNSKQYLSLSKKSKNIIDTYYINKNKSKLFCDIISHIDSLHTYNSKYVVQSKFRSLLTNVFNFSYDDIKPLHFDKSQTEKYNNTLYNNFENKKVITINKQMFADLLNNDILLLLICSGRRWNELSKIRCYKYDDPKASRRDDIYHFECPLLKKKNNKLNFSDINIIGNHKIFYDLFCKNVYLSKLPSSQSVNNKIKYIFSKYEIFNNPNLKLSTHLMRAIYVLLIYRFFNSSDMTYPNVIRKYLGHNDYQSIIHYQYVKLSNDFTSLYNFYSFTPST